MIPFDQLPYRPCVGVVLVNRDGLVFLGQRVGGPEHVDAHHSWQMPQGGIDEGEPGGGGPARALRGDQRLLGRARR